jgi:hypothetical protein
MIENEPQILTELIAWELFEKAEVGLQGMSDGYKEIERLELKGNYTLKGEWKLAGDPNCS